MASGDTLGRFVAAGNADFPASNGASPERNTNNEPVIAFDAALSGDEFCIFSDVLPSHYSGGGITVKLHYSMPSATSGDVIWTSAFEALPDASSVASDSFASANSVTATVPGTANTLDVPSIAHTHGAQIDSLAVGNHFRLRIGRDSDAAGDTATGDAYLHAVELVET